ncbi:alpha/beta fold hydrolase [Paramixta manurensis]|uniref:Alpha/beta fold hydrolase n=1 Tax=Paramixta manurensis TaxID=2740817 RepID=A0A6M8UHP6_9GAMM|nr:alpha/beta fold hydrolase [Erwiniaceae bacterium PD-1]
MLTSACACRCVSRDQSSLYCYIDDAYTDPWSTTDDVLMIHGIAEDGRIWAPWVPYFARRFRVLRPDLRGYGQSSALAQTTDFSIEEWADDLETLLDSVNSQHVHLVATKLGAQIAFELAQRGNPRIASMTLAGMLPVPSAALGPWLDEWIALVELHGVEAWVRATMPGRMADALSPAALAWWIDLMSAAPAGTVTACLRLLSQLHGPRAPESVCCPTLFIVAGDDAASAQPDSRYSQRPAPADLERLQQRVPNASLELIAANSFHITATHPDACAQVTAAFIERITGAARRTGSAHNNHQEKT